MSDERIDIVIQDKVSSAIATKILQIAKNSRDAGTAVERLKAQLNALNGGALQQLITQLNGSGLSAAKLALAQQRLATEVARTAAATANATLAQQRSNAANTLAANAAARLAAQQARATLAQQQAANAAQRLATEQARTAAAAAQAQAAADRAALAALRLQQAQDRAAQSSNRAASGLKNFIQAAAGIAGVTVSAAAVVELGEAYTLLQNKLQAVTESEKQLTTVTQKVFDIANETRTPVDAVGQSFQRFDSSLITLGKSQGDTIRMMRTINKLFVVGGVTATEQGAALLQLSQAFNANLLQQDEYRSLSENMPKAVRRSIAEVLGITESALKKASSEGKITGEVLFQAFKKLEGFADSKFAKTTMTMGQGFTVLKNNAIQFFGEMNKSLGVTASFAKVMAFLGENMKAVAFGLSVISALLLVAFGPALVTMLAVATKAVIAFTVSIATNPIGLLIVGITAAAAAIALFGDQIAVSDDGLVTLKDTAKATWSFVSDAAVSAGDMISSAWGASIDWINSKTDGWGEQFRNVGQFIMSFYKDLNNNVIAIFVGTYNSIVNGWRLLPGAIKDIFAMAVNVVVSANEMMINGALAGINKLTKVANQASEKLGLGKVFDEDLKVSLDQYKMEVSGAAGDLAGVVSKSFKEAFNTDFIGNATNAISKRAAEISKARRAAEAAQASDNGGLRGNGAADPSAPNAKALKAAEQRALALAHINGELDKELRGLYLLKPARETLSKLDQIEINLASKKIKLSDEERESLRGKIKALEDGKATQQAFDAIYEASVAPLRDYTAQLDAATKLLDKGAISSERYQRTIVMAGEAYKAATDPLYLVNRELSQQSELLAKIGPQQEIAQQMQQVKNDLLSKGIVLSQADTMALQSKFEALQNQKNVNQELNKIYSETQGAQLSLQNQATALNQAFAQGLITLDQYSQRLIKVGVDAANLKINMGDGSFTDMAVASLGTLVSSYENAQRSLTDSFGQFFQSFTDGFANSVGRAIVYGDNLKESLNNVAKEAIAGLISALVKLGIQYVVNAALGTAVGASAMATQTAASVAAAATTATAWAVPAALVSAASWGANSVPAMAGLAATVALSEAMALVGSAGFEKGGYTGNGGTKDVAGVVHGKEFVVNAAATARNRGALEAMNRGAAGVSMNSRNVGTGTAGGGFSVSIQNYGSSKEFEVKQISENEVRIIARDEARQAVRKEAPGVFANELRNSNSRVSKSLEQNTQTQRKR